MLSRLIDLDRWRHRISSRLLAAEHRRVQRGTDLPFSSFRNFLLLHQHRALGAAVCSTALLSALQETLPDARIAVAAEGISREIYSAWPTLHRYLEVPNGRQDREALTKALRDADLFQGEPFLAILQPDSDHPSMQKAVLRAGAIACFHTDANVARHTTARAHNWQISRIANDLELLSLLGHGAAAEAQLTANPRLWEPKLYVPAANIAEASSLLERHSVRKGAPFAIIGSQTRPDKLRYWPDEYFCDIADWLHEEHGMQILWTGSKEQHDVIEGLRAGTKAASINIAGETSILTLAALMQQADVLLTHDTGTMHVARGVDLPTVVLAPAQKNPVEWLPLGSARAQVLFNTGIRGESVTRPGITSREDVMKSLSLLLREFSPRKS